jgi:hypothetical protein
MKKIKTKRNRIYLPYDTLCQEIQEYIRIITESERKTTEQEKKEAKDWISCNYFLLIGYYSYDTFIERHDILVLKKHKYHHSLKDMYVLYKFEIKKKFSKKLRLRIKQLQLDL